MKFINSTARIFVPDGKPIADALKRISHLGIGAHQDDLEFMAFHSILECFACEQKCFGGVTCTNGSGSSRTGAYANFTDAQIMSVRHLEQNSAAIVGTPVFELFPWCNETSSHKRRLLQSQHRLKICGGADTGMDFWGGLSGYCLNRKYAVVRLS